MAPEKGTTPTDPGELLARGRARHAARDVATAAALYGEALAGAPAHAEANPCTDWRWSNSADWSSGLVSSGARSRPQRGRCQLPGLQRAPCIDAALMQRIADVAGFGIKWSWPDHGAFRLSPVGSGARSDIHVDDAAGRPTFAGVLYLSVPEHCAGGRSFWRHRATGWERAPGLAELRAHGFADLDAFHRSLDPAGGAAPFESLKAARDKWELVLEIPMRFNRLILYRADHYHAVSEVFGREPADARFVQLFFFERIGG